MNAVEIEEAVSALAEQPFDPVEFPWAFLQAFGNGDVTVKRLRAGDTNMSDVQDGVCQRGHVHLAVCGDGAVSATLACLRESPATAKGRVRFLLASDGAMVEAEDLVSGETLACPWEKLPDHFGFFLPLAGITAIRQIRDNAIDIRAASRMNRLYVELLKDNPDWAAADRRPDVNHFMARLIFCFFAEDTDIFNGEGLFTKTVEQMSDARESANTHQVIGEIFRAMNTAIADRAGAGLRSWADGFPYVNGGLFSGSAEVPRFSRAARSYLLHIGRLEWKQINPDIFGSMIQAVAEDEERGSLGMHYTSVPNILKVLNPLFLDGLRTRLEQAGSSRDALHALRDRLSKIRLFDPACGSGNFLVIAYKEMRAIEAEVNRRCGKETRPSVIPLRNFRGIEVRDFPAEIARLALIIAEYQCNVLYRGPQEAKNAFLPLDSDNWITCGNALRLDWLTVCPPSGADVALRGEDLFHVSRNQAGVGFDNEGGETYICGNPPYRGYTWQTAAQKDDLKAVFQGRTNSWKSLDYVAGWFMKAADYGRRTPSRVDVAFVSTNSICQGQQVPILWPLIFATGHKIAFAHASFKWSNLASRQAGVTVVIVGLSREKAKTCRLFSIAGAAGNDDQEDEKILVQEAAAINAYLVPGRNVIVEKAASPLSALPAMSFGNMPVDGGNLLLSRDERIGLGLTPAQDKAFIRRIYGSAEFIQGLERYCLWIEDDRLEEALRIPEIRRRIEAVRAMRLASPRKTTNKMAKRPHQMGEMNTGNRHVIAVPRVSSENRPYLPVGLLEQDAIINDRVFALYDAPLWTMALVASRLHLIWVATVCGRLKTDFSYSNTLGWNTFPVPDLTDKNKADLTLCAENILLAREVHFPATIAELYDAAAMPDNLRAAHARNDEVLERICIGRRFRNDTERLEHLFERYATLKSRPAAAKNRTTEIPA